MAFLLAIVPTFFVHRYLFQRYFLKRGIVVEGLTSKILKSYVQSIGIGMVVFFFTVWPFLAEPSSSKGLLIVELLSFIVWGGGFIVPAVLQMKKRIGAPWGPTLLITLSPIVLTILVWNVLAQSFS